MNKLFKFFAVIFFSMFVVSSAFAQVSINGEASGKYFIVKSGKQNLLTARGCAPGTVTWTLDRWVSADPMNPEVHTIDWPQNTDGPSYPYTIGGTDYNTTVGLGLDPADIANGMYFKCYQYQMTCTPSGGGSSVSRTITFVATKNDEFKPVPEDGYSPKYNKCGDPTTLAGSDITVSAGLTRANSLFIKKPSAGSFTNIANSANGYTRMNYTNAAAETGTYQFKFAYYRYIESGAIVSNDFSNVTSMEVLPKTGSPLAIGDVASMWGLSMIVNDKNPNNGTVTSCASDKVVLDWANWDTYRNDERFKNYNFVWAYENNGLYMGFSPEVKNPDVSDYFGIKNYANVGFNKSNFKLRFIPYGQNEGCPIDEFDNATFSGNPSFPSGYNLSLNVKASGMAMITSVDNNYICPDGTTVLKLAEFVTTLPALNKVNWYYNGQLITGPNSTGTSLTIDKAGNYNAQYLCDDPTGAWVNINGETCLSVMTGVVVQNYNRPNIPSVTSSSKVTEYCDYAKVSDILTASSGSVAAKGWEWFSTAKTAGTSLNEKYSTADFGTYNARYKDANGCWSLKSSDFVISPIARPATPTIKLTGSAFNCAKDEAGNVVSVKFDLTSPTLTATGSTYQWYIGSSTTAVQNSALASLAGIVGTSDVKLTQTDGKTGCVSLPSAVASVTFQANPVFASGSITKTAYTLNAKGLDATGAGNYVWKLGSAALAGTTAIQKVQGGAGEYSVARYVSYTSGSNTISCLSTAIKYAYVPDPEFNGVIVYPNPATTSVIVDVVDTATWNGADVSIFDMLGRKVYAGTYSTSSGIDVSGIGVGIYVLNLNAKSGNTFQTKLLINR